MGRRRDDSPWMTIFDLFTKLPWPLGVGSGILVFLAMRFLLPLRFGNDPSDTMWKTLLCTGPLPYLVAGAFVGGGIVSAVMSAGRRKLYQGQQSLGDIRGLSWREFETYVGEAYRRQGYTVEETGGGGADGGVDLILRRAGETVLVQCKQWRQERVPINVVREMYGLLCAESASRVVIATTGDFTPDARAFAGDKPIELLNGRRLEQMVFGARNAPSVAPPRAPAGAAAGTPPVCPSCGATMVLRTAKRGVNAGNSFYGCSRYPHCRGIVQVTQAKCA